MFISRFCCCFFILACKEIVWWIFKLESVSFDDWLYPFFLRNHLEEKKKEVISDDCLMIYHFFLWSFYVDLYVYTTLPLFTYRPHSGVFHPSTSNGRASVCQDRPRNSYPSSLIRILWVLVAICRTRTRILVAGCDVVQRTYPRSRTILTLPNPFCGIF